MKRISGEIQTLPQTLFYGLTLLFLEFIYWIILFSPVLKEIFGILVSIICVPIMFGIIVYAFFWSICKISVQKLA